MVTGGLPGVLFDSGGTLLRPIGGRWNPRFDFEEVLLRHVPDASPDRFPAAVAAGQTFLDEAPSTPRRVDYHRVVLAALGVDDPPDRLLADLDRRLDVPVVESFPEVVPVLDKLFEVGVPMAIVSDSWPGLEATYGQLGLGRYFRAFVISAVLGCNKPDPRMYRAASDALGLAPDECLFVDDDPDLVAAALALGYRGLAVCRDGPCRRHDVPSVSDLTPLPPMLGGA